MNTQFCCRHIATASSYILHSTFTLIMHLKVLNLAVCPLLHLISGQFRPNLTISTPRTPSVDVTTGRFSTPKVAPILKNLSLTRDTIDGRSTC